jgi:hypothetical protein
MKRQIGPVLMAAVLAVAFGLPVVTAAQAPPADIPVTGCLVKVKGAFRLTKATPAPRALEPGAPENADRGTWILEAREDAELETAVGHRVEITGQPKQASDQQTAGTTRDGRKQPRTFVLHSLKKVGEPCQ